MPIGCPITLHTSNRTVQNFAYFAHGENIRLYIFDVCFTTLGENSYMKFRQKGCNLCWAKFRKIQNFALVNIFQKKCQMDLENNSPKTGYRLHSKFKWTIGKLNCQTKGNCSTDSSAVVSGNCLSNSK